MKNSTLYETDFAKWSQETAEAIRQRRFDGIDLTALANEIEDMGRNDQRELNSRLTILIGHLLKYQFQPERRTVSRHNTIVVQRADIAGLLQQSPSLKQRLDLAAVYPNAVDLAAGETGLSGKLDFPRECPYTVEQILSSKYWPGKE